MMNGAHYLTLATMAEELGLTLEQSRQIVEALKLHYDFALNNLPYWNAKAKYVIREEAIARGWIQ